MMLSSQLKVGLILLSVLTLPFANALASSANVSPTPVPTSSQLKVLAIGNSFSQDALEHLYKIAAEAGAKEIVLGNLYIGGAELSLHWNNAKNNLAQYRYDKNVDGTWKSQSNKTILYGLQDEDWDIITLQQASGYSGVAASYTAGDLLQQLIDYVNEHKTNPHAKLAWHMTWAYQSDSKHASFPTYNRNQSTMYTSIVNAVQEKVVPNNAFSFVIPTGTAIQNVRTSYIGDTLTRDGYHLSLNLGRYIAALTWLHAITGWSIDNLTYVPSTTDIPNEYMPIIKEAVKAAVKNPFTVTNSSYIVRPQSSVASIPQLNYDAYKLLNWEPVGCAYWQSNSSTLSTVLNSKQNSTAGNLCYFVSSGRMFNREEIPVGSIIEVDAGYQYRPEGWTSITRQSARQNAVTTSRVVVTDAWWGSYKYRAFNVSVAGSTTDISKAVAETAAKFRIYVPK